MDIFSVFTLGGGLAFFLYGMTVMSSSLSKMAGGKLESTIKKMTSNSFKGLFLGAGITIAIQSSSAMTVMLVGLVNSGIMSLSQTIPMIMGSNIGTTLTAWILSLTGIESGNFFIRLLKPDSFSPVIALVGIIMIMVSKSERKKDVGEIFIGFAVLMYGMKLMSSAVSPLADMPEFASILTMFENPILGVITGAVFTGIIQSSAASVGILQALSLTGSMTFGMAIPIIMGQNIGTCVTSLLSAIGTNKNAKRVAAVHVYFNLIGTVLFLIVYYAIQIAMPFDFLDNVISPVGIAFSHSVFNVATTAVLFPFSKLLGKLATLTIKDTAENKEEQFSVLDERLLRSPSLAIAEAKNLAVKMAETARDSLISAARLLDYYDEKAAAKIIQDEDAVDKYEDKLGTWLVKLSGMELSNRDSSEISRLLHTIGDFERISDHAVNVLEAAREMRDKGISFSSAATSEVRVISRAVEEILIFAVEAFKQNNFELALNVEPLEQVVDELTEESKNRHIERLQSGKCTIELGFILSDLLTNFERVSDHCSNVAICVIQLTDSGYNPHSYLEGVKNPSNKDFVVEYKKFKEKYLLPL